MANTTFFIYDEQSPLSITDDGLTPQVGYVSAKGVPVDQGEGDVQPDQRLLDSTADGLSEKTDNVKGRITFVSWLTRSTVNQYGVTKLPPKV